MRMRRSYASSADGRVSAIQALIREDRAAHCMLTSDTLCCRYHVMVAALDHAQKAAVRRSWPDD
jgi:hypothetical protein